MRASMLLTALATAASACAVSPDVTPYPIDAQTGMVDAPGPVDDASGPPPDAGPMGGDGGGPGGDAGPGANTVGWPEPFVGERIIIPGETLIAFKLPPVPVDGSLELWGIIPADGGDAPIRMALYSDLGAQPGVLINWTEVWRAGEREHPGGGGPIAAGTYWLAVLGQIDFEIGQNPAEYVESCVRTHFFDAPFEPDFGPADCTLANPINLYLRLGAAPGPSPVAPAVAPR